MCRTWGSNSGPLTCQANSLPIELPHPVDQPRHPPSLIRVFAVRMKKAWVLSYPMSAQRRLRSDWANAQADLSLRWAQSFCWFCREVAHISHRRTANQNQKQLPPPDYQRLEFTFSHLFLLKVHRDSKLRKNKSLRYRRFCCYLL